MEATICTLVLAVGLRVCGVCLFSVCTILVIVFVVVVVVVAVAVVRVSGFLCSEIKNLETN